MRSLFRGLPGYHFVGQTILAGRLGHSGRIAGISASIACLVVFFVGGTMLSFLPVGLFVSVIAYLGLDLLHTWLWAERPNLKPRDYLIVLLIPVVAITFSFLAAIAVGLCVAVLFLSIPMPSRTSSAPRAVWRRGALLWNDSIQNAKFC